MSLARIELERKEIRGSRGELLGWAVISVETNELKDFVEREALKEAEAKLPKDEEGKIMGRAVATDDVKREVLVRAGYDKYLEKLKQSGEFPYLEEAKAE